MNGMVLPVPNPKFLLLVVVALAVLGSTGCTMPIGEFAAAPIVDYSKSDSGEMRVIVRPLVSYHRVDEENREWTALYPFYRDHKRGNERRSWLLPVYYRTANENKFGQMDDDSILLTAFWGSDAGDSPTGGNYFMLFPLGGSLKGLFAQERIDMGLFPLYMRVKNDTGKPTARRSYHYLWPFINHVEGERDSGFRIWPFYSHYESFTERGAKRFDHTAILWPFFIWNDDALDSSRPVKTRMFFPFYGRTRSPTIERTSVLWPFFQYQDFKRREFKSLTIFPVTTAWGKNVSQYDFWPLFAYKKTPNYLRQSLLWLVQRYERAESQDELTEDFWFLPLYRYHHRQNLDSGEDLTHTRFWPLYSYTRDMDGSVRFAFPDLLPFRDQERFEPLYARLWRLYRYTDMRDRGSRWDVLWGLFSGEKLGEAERLSLFGGLIQRERDEEGIHWRVFYFLRI